MSDYLYLLESHLSAEQNRVVAEAQAAAAQANVSLFLTGGAMRDMLGGFHIRDLDFTIEGNPLKLAKAIADKAGGRIVSMDEHRRAAELLFQGGATAGISMARTERFTRSGARPQVMPAAIQDDLHRRDFTINAIALSLNRGSRGLLVDPTNGLGDLNSREIRTTHPNALFDDPVRLLRLIRLSARMGFTIEERTRRQFESARDSGLHKSLPAATLLQELRRIADEPNPAEVLRNLDQEGMLEIFSPALRGAKLNLAGLGKLEKLRRMMAVEGGIEAGGFAPFLRVLTEKFSPKEASGLASSLGIPRADVDAWHKLEPRVKALERALRSPQVHQPSRVYKILSRAPGDEILFLLYQSQQRIVQDRVRNYVQKYHRAALEVTDAEVQAAGAAPGSPKFQKLKDQMISARLNARPKKPPPPEPEPPVAEPSGPNSRGRPPRPPAAVAQQPPRAQTAGAANPENPARTGPITQQRHTPAK